MLYLSQLCVKHHVISSGGWISVLEQMSHNCILGKESENIQLISQDVDCLALNANASFDSGTQQDGSFVVSICYLLKRDKEPHYYIYSKNEIGHKTPSLDWKDSSGRLTPQVWAASLWR